MKTVLATLVAIGTLTAVAVTTVQAAKFGSRDFWIERSTNQN